MAQWQIFKGKTSSGAAIQSGEVFDDGRLGGPGDDGFSVEYVQAEVKKRSADSYSFVGKSTQISAHMKSTLEGAAAEIVASDKNEIEDIGVARILVAKELGLNVRGL